MCTDVTVMVALHCSLLGLGQDWQLFLLLPHILCSLHLHVIFVLYPVTRDVSDEQVHSFAKLFMHKI